MNGDSLNTGVLLPWGEGSGELMADMLEGGPEPCLSPWGSSPLPHSPCRPLGQHLKGQLARKSRQDDESTCPGPGKEASAETAGRRLTCAHHWPGVVLPEFYSGASADRLEAWALLARFSSVHRCSHCSCILASEMILSNHRNLPPSLP